MSSLRPIELSFLDEIFRGNSDRGYVLDFSNRTFADFFALELEIDIDAVVYFADGESKAKRLRCFLRLVDDLTAARTIKALWDRRVALQVSGIVPNAGDRVATIIAKLTRNGSSPPVNVVPAPVLEMAEFSRLYERLMVIRKLEPHQRGYEFERFLTDLFDAFRLEAREPFRLVGEQIDGSIELAGEVYLVEAKWLSRKVGVAELHNFHGKVAEKAAWARGIFISFAGFTDDGLTAFGRAKRIIGMEGLDIHDALKRGIGIDRLLASKVRRAAETGEIFVPIQKLIP